MNVRSLSCNLLKPGQIKPLDGLRAIAILLVLITHICQRIPSVTFVAWNTEWATPLYNGWIGVDLFFVLSGFLVGTVVIRGLNDHQFSVKLFFLHRFFRILPAYFFVIFTLVMLKKWLPQLYTELFPSFGSNVVLANLLLLTDYLPRDMGIPSWSLSIEEQFYLLLPVFLIFFKKLNTRVYAVLSLIASALIIRMITYRAYGIGEHVPIQMVLSLIYFPFHTRMDSLAVGVLVALLNYYSPITDRIFRIVASSVGLLLVGYVYLTGALMGGFFNTTIQYTLVCIGFGALLWGVLGVVQTSQTKLQSLLSSSYWVPVARISYSVYLTHLLTLMLLNHFFVFKIWMFIFILMSCFLVALPLYLFVEYPFHQFARMKFTNKRLLVDEPEMAFQKGV